GKVLEVRLGESSGVAHCLFRRNRSVGFHGKLETIVVGTLANSRFSNGEVGAANRVVDGVDAHQVNRCAALHHVLVGLDVSAALVHVQLEVDVALVLNREEEVRFVYQPNAGGENEVAGGHGSRAAAAQADDGLFDIVVQSELERLQVADDLVNIFHDAGNRLVLVEHAVQAERPHGRSSERGQEHAAHCVAEGMSEAALERLDAELRDSGSVITLNDFNE